MSGVVGLFYLNGNLVLKEDLVTMLNSQGISRRGQDCNGLWNEGSVGLGQCAFWATPEQEFEKQPLIDNQNELVIVLDGRIDNRKELLEELNIVSNTNITDCEIILRLYKIHQENTPHKLIGDFAFIIWDKKNQCIFCAKDALGIKPLFYYKDHNLIAFASDPAGIFAHKYIRKDLNLDGCKNYLNHNYNELEITVFKNLSRFPPAHYAKISTRNDLTIRKYWEIDPNKKIVLKTKEEYKELFLETFTRTLKDQTRTTKKIGITVSGGLDSSSVFCLLKDLQSKGVINADISGYSVTFNEKECDESKYVDDICKKWKTQITRLQFDPPIPIWSMQEGLRNDALPLIHDTSAVKTLFNGASKDGCKIIFTGLGGDDFLSTRKGYVTNLIYKGRIIRALKYIYSTTLFHNGKFHEALLHFFIKEAIIEKSKSFIKNIIKKPQNRIIPPPISQWYANYLSLVFEEWDRIAASELVELRHPLCDRRIVELAFSFPKEEIVQGERPKGILRETLKNKLPDSIKNRIDKVIFNYVFNKNVYLYEQEYAKKIITNPELENLTLLTRNKCSTIFDKYIKKCAINMNKPSPYDIWNMLVLEEWLQKVKSKDLATTSLV